MLDIVDGEPRHTPQQGCDLSLSQLGYGWDDDNDSMVKLTNLQGLVIYRTTAMHDVIATKSMVCYMLVYGFEVLIRILRPLRSISCTQCLQSMHITQACLCYLFSTQNNIDYTLHTHQIIIISFCFHS